MTKELTTFICSFDRMVDDLVVTGLFTESQARALMSEKRKEQILKEHEYGIWEAEDRGHTVYRTKVEPKGGKPKKIQSNSIQGLEDKIVQFYVEQAMTESNELLTFRALFDEWLDYRAKRKSAGTIERHKVAWKKYFLDEPLAKDLLDTPISRIDGIELDDFFHHMITKYEMTRHTYQDFSVIPRKALAYAKDVQHYIKVNPMESITVEPREQLFEEDPKTSNESIFYSEDVERIIEYAWEQYRSGRQYVQKFVPLAIVFLFYTGLRLGEVTGIKFSDVDGDLLHIKRSYSKDAKKVIAKVKKKECRDIPLIPEALEVIEEVKSKKLELGMPIDGYIFSANESSASTYKAIGKMVGKYCNELELYRHSAHDARRTFVSQLHANGCPAATIMQMTGHRDYKCFERSYLFDTKEHEAKKAYLSQAFA